LVDTSPWGYSDHLDYQSAFVDCVKNPPVANPQTTLRPVDQLLYIIARREWISSQQLDFIHDEHGCGARHAFQSLGCVSGIFDGET